MAGLLLFCMGLWVLGMLILAGWTLASIIHGFVAGARAEWAGWDLHHSTGAWAYYVNRRTGMRKAVFVAGHSPLDYRFLRVGDMVVDEIGSHLVSK